MAAARGAHQGADPRDTHAGAVPDHPAWGDSNVGAEAVSRQRGGSSDPRGKLEGRPPEAVAVGKLRVLCLVSEAQGCSWVLSGDCLLL